jgi:hypothetical protein
LVFFEIFIIIVIIFFVIFFVECFIVIVTRAAADDHEIVIDSSRLPTRPLAPANCARARSLQNRRVKVTLYSIKREIWWSLTFFGLLGSIASDSNDASITTTSSSSSAFRSSRAAADSGAGKEVPFSFGVV